VRLVLLCGNGPDLEHVVAEDREQLIFDGLGAGYRKCADEQVTGVVHEPSLAECSAGRYRIRRPLTSFYRAERAGVRIPQPDRVDTPMRLEFAKAAPGYCCRNA